MNARRGARKLALLFYVAISIAAVAGTIGAAVLAGKDPDPAWAWLLKCVAVFVLVVGLAWVFMKKQAIGWRRYGVSASAKACRLALIGFMGGIALACAWAAIVWLWAPYALNPNPAFSIRALVLGTLATLLMGVAEEVGYRTFGLELLERGFGPAVAVVLPSVLFAVMHTTGGMPWLAAFSVVGSCSVLYGTLMLATRSLPLVAAFHIANNLLQDAAIRTGEGSLLKPSFNVPTGDSAPSANIWLCIMATNLTVACFVWRKRAGAFPG